MSSGRKHPKYEDITSRWGGMKIRVDFAGAQNSRTPSVRRLQAKTSRRENIYFLATESYSLENGY